MRTAGRSGKKSIPAVQYLAWAGSQVFKSEECLAWSPWELNITIPSGWWISDIQFADDGLHGCLALIHSSSGGRIYYTSDGGETWSQEDTSASGDVPANLGIQAYGGTPTRRVIGPRTNGFDLYTANTDTASGSTVSNVAAGLMFRDPADESKLFGGNAAASGSMLTFNGATQSTMGMTASASHRPLLWHPSQAKPVIWARNITGGAGQIYAATNAFASGALQMSGASNGLVNNEAFQAAFADGSDTYFFTSGGGHECNLYRQNGDFSGGVAWDDLGDIGSLLGFTSAPYLRMQQHGARKAFAGIKDGTLQIATSEHNDYENWDISHDFGYSASSAGITWRNMPAA